MSSEPTANGSAELGRVRTYDVAFQLVNDFFLLRDDPFHKIALRDHSHDGVVFDHRKMSKAICGHDRHAFVYGPSRTDGNEGGGHDIANQNVLRHISFQD